MQVLSRTRAFRTFRRTVGDSTAHINTAFVGTELIARGAKKPDDLRIKWNEPNDREGFIAQTRSYLHTAFLHHIFSALDCYLRDLAALPYPWFSETQKDLLRKAAKLNGKDLSIDDRFSCLEVLPKADEPNRNLVKVLVAWRNQQVHSFGEQGEVRGARLVNALCDALIAEDSFFRSNYGDLDITRTLANVRSNHAPSRKDIVAIVSAAQNFTWTVDQLLIRKHLSTNNDYETLGRTVLRGVFLPDDGQRLRKLWNKGQAARDRKFLQALEEAGFKEDKNALIGLSENFISDLVLQDVEEAIQRLSH